MNRLGFFLVSALLALAAAGCAGMQSQTSGGATPAVGTHMLPPAVERELSLTMRHYIPAVSLPDRGTSWMLPEAKKSPALIYAGVWATNDVYVLNYSTGKLVGTLTGLNEPYGQCVDAKGDVYVANFGGGNVMEYAHGGTKVIKTYDTGGNPIGCSVDAKGDVAVTIFDPGSVIVFAKSKETTYSGSCEFLWPMGYDNKRALIGIGEEYTGKVIACGLLPGSKSMTMLYNCCQGPITIDLPGGTMWDGKYIALGDQEANGGSDSGIWPSKLVGGTLNSPSEIVLGACNSEYQDVVSAFLVGKKNTPVNSAQAKIVAGPGPSCSGGGVALWHYPSGTFFKSFKVSAGTVYGVSVSFAQ